LIIHFELESNALNLFCLKAEDFDAKMCVNYAENVLSDCIWETITVLNDQLVEINSSENQIGLGQGLSDKKFRNKSRTVRENDRERER
jgi:hypothetical protein